jgi:hypothetical protein
MLAQVPGDLHDSDPDSGRPRCGSSEPNMVDAHCARACRYTPTVNRKAQPDWEQWLTATRTAIRKHAIAVWGSGTPHEHTATRLIHAHCRRHAGDGTGTAPLRTRQPRGLA